MIYYNGALPHCNVLKLNRVHTGSGRETPSPELLNGGTRIIIYKLKRKGLRRMIIAYRLELTSEWEIPDRVRQWGQTFSRKLDSPIKSRHDKE
jgi:hypothetical protein